jgi:hypothetical protein
MSPDEFSGLASRKITELTIMGKNVGTEMLSLHDAYIISNVTGQKINGTVNTEPFPQVTVPETAPVPPTAWLLFHFKFANDLTGTQLSEEWKAFTVYVQYDTSEVHHAFSSEDVARMALAIYPQSAPHVTKRQ